MQSAEDRPAPDWSSIRRLNLSGLGYLLLQPKMRPVAMVVVEVLVENPPQMLVVEDDHMIQAFPPDRPDRSFDVRILPRRVRRGEDLFDLEHQRLPGLEGRQEGAEDEFLKGTGTNLST